MNIRTAKAEDLPRLRNIYNYEVENGVATLDLLPRTIEDRRVWFEAHNIENHPLIVAEEEGTVMGYASLSGYREKEAYRSTVELSVYVAPECRRRGVATALMESILEDARRDPSIHLVISVITSGNEASIKLHERFGFTFCGSMHQVGVKFGRYLDIDNYELLVEEAD